MGISATAVGVIFLAVPFLKIVTNPLFGVIVDYFKKIRLTLSLTMIFVAVTHVAMLYIPPLHRTSQFRENDLQVQIKYHCFEEALFDNKNVSYLEIYSRLESTLQSDLVDISCDITCNSKTLPENVEKPSSCISNISFKSQLILKRRHCRYEHSFPAESSFMYQNSTRKLLKLGKSIFNFNQFFKDESEQNCSLTNHIDPENKMESTANGNLSIMRSMKNLKLNNSLFMPSSFKDTSEHSYVLNVQELFLTEEEDCHLRHSSCLKWLSCMVKNCSTNKLQVDMVPPDEFHSSSFWMLFMLIGTSSVCFAAVCFLIDAVCYEMLDSKEKYGLQRLWGTIGWGLGAFVGGYLNQLISTEDSTTDYSLSFYLLALLIIIALIPVSRIRVENLKYSPNICKDVCILFSNIHLVINIFMVSAIGVISGLMWNYQFWFMEEIGSSQMLLGLSQIAECWFAELPCFVISGWVIRKIGYTNCNSLTFFCFGLRYLFFAYMQDPWMTLPIALIYGPTFGIFFASMTMYGKTEAPPGTEATVQSILAVAFEGVGK